jgi:hypothetical protein
MTAAAPTKQIPALDMGVPVQYPVVAYATDGAITLIAGGIAILTKGSAGAYTLAAPVGSGAVLIIVAGSAQAHVVTVTGMAVGSGQDVGTFGGAINDSTILVSYNSQWYVAGGTRNVTWA